MNLAIIDTGTGRVARTVKDDGPVVLRPGEVVINPAAQRYDPATRCIVALKAPVLPYSAQIATLRETVAAQAAKIKALEDQIAQLVAQKNAK